jgi:hypothetical protein
MEEVRRRASSGDHDVNNSLLRSVYKFGSAEQKKNVLTRGARGSSAASGSPSR